MVSNPQEAESLGQQFIEATFRGHVFRVPLDVDLWPLHLVRGCRLAKVDAAGNPIELIADKAAILEVLRRILGDQWDDFLWVATKRRHWVEASQVFAEAVGFGARNGADIAFGALPWLLAVLEEWPEKVESDLDRFWNIDYAHRWQFADGRRRLSLRKIHARLQNLPVDSAIAIALNKGRLHRSGAELVLMDLWELHANARHPSRPRSDAEIAAAALLEAQEAKAIADRAARNEKRRNRQSGVANARENARRQLRREAQPDAQDQV